MGLTSLICEGQLVVFSRDEMVLQIRLETGLEKGPVARQTPVYWDC